jgi:hypothetical protein
MKRAAASPVAAPGPKRSAPAAGAAAAGAAGPVPLIDLGEGPSATMRVTDEARRILQEAGASGRPVVVVCVVGRSRTGKSFLLNRGLMNARTGGFTVSPSTRACTKGLWIAGPPVPAAEFWANLGVATKAAEMDYDVLVVDTEGINALDRDQSYDMRIFTLALLLSSVFVYNSLGAIDENAISTLSAVASVAESLKQQNGGGSGGSGGSGRRGANAAHAAASPLELPGLLWVVRDFALDIEREGDAVACEEDDEGGAAGPGSQGGAAAAAAGARPLDDDGYLEEALRADMFDPRSSKGMLRRVLNDAFPCRSCQTMVRPAEREEDMKQLQSLPDGDLRPEFVEQLGSLRRKLFSLSRPKRVAGRAVDASLLADLAATYVEAINGDRVPAVADAWTQVTRARCEKGVSQAVAYVERLLESVSGGAAGPPSALQLHPALLHAHVAYGLRTADALYRQHIRGVPDTSEFDRQLQQRLLVAVASATHRAKEAQEAAGRRLADVAVERWAGMGGPGAPSAAAFLSSAVRAVEEALREVMPPSDARLPPPEYSPDIVPPMVEDGPRRAVEASLGERWGWLALQRLAASPDLLAARNIALPSTGVSPEELKMAREEAGRESQRADEAERQLGAERERTREAERRAADAEAQRDVALERAAAAEAGAEIRVSKIAETSRLGSATEVAALVAEAEARGEEKLRRTIESYEHDLDEREEQLEAARRRAANLQAEVAEGLRGQEELRGKLAEAERRVEAAGQRHQALEAEVARSGDALAARTAEVQRLTREHGQERLEWATRLRTSETEAARAAGNAEALAARVKALETLHAQLEETRRGLHAAEVALARAEAEKRAAEAERDRARDSLSRKEDELRDGLRTLKEIGRTLRNAQ